MILALTVAAQPVNPDYTTGVQDYHRSDWDGAISNFTKSITANYDLYNSYSYRAYALAVKGDTNGALADCTRLIALEPRCACVYFWRSRVELKFTNGSGRDTALRDYEIGLRMDPVTRPADVAGVLSAIWCQKGLKKYIAGQLDASILDLSEAILIDPIHPSTYSLRGFVKLLQGQFDKAINDALIALKYNPKYTEAYVTLAWARFERGDVTGAMEACTKAQKIASAFTNDDLGELNYQQGELKISAGLLNFINGDFTKAADDWGTSIKLIDGASGGHMPPLFRAFLQSWIEKARAKQREAKNNALAGTNSSPASDGR